MVVGSYTNSQGILTVSGGVASVTSNLVAGAFTNASGAIQITGGCLTVTNASAIGQLVIGQMGQGVFTQSAGTVTVDQLQVANGTNSVFILNAGSFNTRSTLVSNTQTFVVGDGVDVATFHLLGGVHSFINGLEISCNSFLTGCGTINGNLLVDAGGKVQADCGGTLTFTGTVTNNGLLWASNGSVLESYGPVVNNGVLDIIGGNTNFHAGFVNNGIILTTNCIPQILSITAVGSSVEVEFTTAAVLTYVLEYTGDLAATNWTPLVGFSGPGGNVTMTDFNALLQTQRFYRVRLVVQP
jgi:hypothetical protein